MNARLSYLGTVVFGGLHALVSLYWGLGGEWLLDTVGRQALELRAAAPWWYFAALIGVGLVKLVAVAVPLANAAGRLAWPQVWRALSWIGAIGLLLYGGVLTVTSQLALAGVFGEVGDRPGMIGHALLWDPLFFAWGLCLALALWLERRARPAVTDAKAPAVRR